MRDCNIDLDLSLFKGDLADGTFLTKARRNSETRKIEVTYHRFKNGEVQDSYVVNYYDNYYNSQFVMGEEIDSLLMLIEINDENLYHKMDVIDVRLKELKKSYTFYEVVSWLCSVSAISYGFALINLNENPDILVPVLLSSTFLMMLGIYARRKNLSDKSEYDYGYENMFSEVEKKSEGYSRRKKVGC